MSTKDLSVVQDKFNSGNAFIQREGINRLLESLAHHKITTTATTPPYDLLVNSLTHESYVVGEACVKGLLYLIKNGIVELKRGLNDLLNSMPSIKNPQTVSASIKILIDIFILDYQDTQKLKQQTNVPSNPLIKLIKSRNDIWIELSCLVSETIKKMTNPSSQTNIPSKNIFTIFWPFLFHTLTEPSSSIPLTIRANLHSQLTRIASTTLDKELPTVVLSHLIAIQPLFPCNEQSNLSFTLNAFQEDIDVLSIYLSKKPDSNDAKAIKLKQTQLEKLLFQLCAHLLSLGCQVKSHGSFSLLPVLVLLQYLATKCPAVLSFHTLTFTLGWLLIDATELEIRIILSILSNTADYLQASDLPDTFRVILPFLVYPLLQVTTLDVEDLKSSASILLGTLELMISSTRQTPKPFKELLPATSFLHETFSMIVNTETFIINHFTQKTDMKWSEWLSSLKQISAKKDHVTYLTQYTVAPFLFHTQFSVRSSANQLLSKLAQLSPLTILSFLPMLLYQLGREDNPEIKTEILYTIPTLATHTSSVSPVLRVITPMLQLPALKAVGIRLLCKLYQIQERTFPRLQTALTEYAVNAPLDVRISIASSVKDVCYKKSQRGVDIISVISKLITQDPHPTPASYGLESLSKLCKEDVVEFKAAWSVISQSLSSEKRPLVLTQLAEFFGNGHADAASLAEDDEERFFYDNIIKKLWDLTTHTEPAVRKQAYQSLRLYAEGNIEYFSTVEPTTYVKLLTDSDNEARKEAEAFVSSVLKYESTSRRRGYDTDSSSSNPNLVLLSSLVKLIAEHKESSTKPALRSAIAGGMLFAFRPPASKDDHKLMQIPRRVLVAKAQAYNRALVDLINDISARDDRDWILRLIAIPAWINFMRECTQACIQGEIAQASISGEEIDERTATERSTEKLIKKLREKLEETPKMAEHAAIALACLAVSLPSLAYDLIEKIADIVKALFVKGEHEWLQYGCATGLGLISHALQATDVGRHSDFTTLLTQSLKDNESEWVKFACANSLGLLGASLYKQSTFSSNQNTEQEPNNSNTTENTDSFKQTTIQQIRTTLQAVVCQEGAELESKWSVLGGLVGQEYLSVVWETTRDFGALQEQYSQLVSYIKEANLSKYPDSSLFLGACVTLPSIASRCFRLDLITSAEIGALLETYQTALQSSSKYSVHCGPCIGIASLAHSALVEGYSFPAKYLDNLEDLLITFAKNRDNTHSRIGAVVGLANLLGAYLVIPSSKVSSDTSLLNSAFLSPTLLSNEKNHQFVDKAVSVIRSAFESDSDARVSRHAVWVLGSLCRPIPAATFATGIPSNLNYLPDTSLIRALFSMLQSSLSQSNTAVPHQVESGLRCLTETPKLPPVRWETLLLNLQKAGFGTSVRQQVVRFAAKNIQDQALLSLLSDWCEPSRFLTMEPELATELLEALPTTLAVFPSSRARKAIADLVPIVFQSDNKPLESKMMILRILEACLKNTNIPTPVTAEIHNVLLDLLSQIPSPLSTSTSSFLNKDALDLLNALVSCLKLLPTELVIPRITVGQNETVETAVKCSVIASSLVDSGYCPTSILQSFRTWLLSQSDKNIVPFLVSASFLVTSLGKVKDTNEKSKWILDTLDSVLLCPNPRYAFHLLSALCIQWTHSEAHLLFTLNHNTKWFVDTPSFDYPAAMLAIALPALLKSNTFNPLTEKIVSRLSTMLASPKMQSIQTFVAQCLLALRHTTSFVHSTAWSSLDTVLMVK